MKKRFTGKMITLFIIISVLVSGFSVNIFAAGGEIIEEEDILADGSATAIWHLDEGEGTTIRDSGKYNLNGTFYRNSSIGDWYYWILGRERSGIRSSSYYNSFVAINTHAFLNFRKIDSFSISAWIKSNGTSNKWQGVITKGRHSDQWYGIWISSNNRWVFGGQGQNIFGPTVTPGWHHVVIVQDGFRNMRYLYVDGSLAGTGHALDATRSGPLLFGKAGGVDEHFNGEIDEVCLYRYNLSSLHIKDIWEKQEHTLNVPVYGQYPYNNISWATSSSMIVSYFRQDYGDRDIEYAKGIYGNTYFDKPASTSQVMNIVERNAYVNAKRTYGPLAFYYLQGHILNNQPFIARIGHKDSNGNLTGRTYDVVVRGYFINKGEFTPTYLSKYVRINNPGRTNGHSALIHYERLRDNADYKWLETITFTRR